MLNKELCKKCNQKYSEKGLENYMYPDAPFTYNKNLGIYLCFTEDFENRWYSYKDVCTVEKMIIKDDNVITGRKDNNIPQYCPYILEHLMSSEIRKINMLNKDICKKCINKQWNEDDEKSWKINIIFCAKSCTKLNSNIRQWGSSALSGYRSINQPPPKQCPYYLEHLLIDAY